MNYKQTIRIPLSTALLIVLAGASVAACASLPKVLSPVHGAEVPADTETLPCPEESACYRINVQGIVSVGSQAFVLVAPLAAAPRAWVQPRVIVRSDGTFDGIAYLGTEDQGAGERFQILVLSHKDKGRFKEGEALPAIPEDCAVSDPVTVLRRR